MLKERLCHAVMDMAQTGALTTYKYLADRLGLVPEGTIHRIGEALETLMKDVVAGRPMLAALCVSRIQPVGQRKPRDHAPDPVLASPNGIPRTGN